MKRQHRRRSIRARQMVPVSIGDNRAFCMALAAYLDATLNMVQVPSSDPATFITTAQQWEQARASLIAIIDRHCASMTAQNGHTFVSRFGHDYPSGGDHLTEKRNDRKRL